MTAQAGPAIAGDASKVRRLSLEGRTFSNPWLPLVYFVLLLGVGVVIVLNPDSGVIWSVFMLPVLVAAIVYKSRIYLPMHVAYASISLAAIAIASRNKVESLMVTTAFMIVVLLTAESLYRLSRFRDRAREALAASESRFRLLSQNAPVAIYQADSAGRCTFINDRWGEMTGYARSDAAGQNWIEATHPDDLAELMAHRQQAASERIEFSFQHRILTRDGETRWVVNRGTPVLDGGGGLMGFVGTMEDITQRVLDGEALLKAKEQTESTVRERTAELTAAVARLEDEVSERMRAEQELKQSDERFATAFRMGPSMIVISGEDDRLIEVNEAFSTVFGYSPEEVIGKTFPELGMWPGPEVRQVVGEEIERQRERGGVGRNIETTLRTKKGEAREVLFSTAPIVVNHEPCYLTVAMDITERKRLERQMLEYAESLQLALRQLSTAQEAERRRLAMDLHDGPLQSLGISLLAVDRARRRLGRGEAEIVDGELNYLRTTLSGIVGEVRSVLADLSADRLMTHGLADALQGHIERFQDLTGIKARLHYRVRSRLRMEIELLAYRLAQEALSNVRKHSNATAVTVTISRKGRNLCMTVEDDGVGFDAAKASESKDDGARLGLRSMRQRVLAMRGEMHIVSSPGAGTKLEFVVPSGHYGRGEMAVPHQEISA